MKRFLALIFCVGIALTTLTAVYASPPDVGKAQVETVTTDATTTTDVEFSLNYATLKDVSHRAAQKAWDDTAEKRAQIMDTSPIMESVAILRANSVDRQLVAHVMNKMGRYRWRESASDNPPDHTDKIYRPGWNRKICKC
jgi:FtsP/CotA-like multicopper oxidase with cupredoxin domain